MKLAQLTLPIGDVANSVGIPGADTAADPSGGFSDFLGQILAGVFAIAALLVFLYLIWGAIQWITSGGDKGKVEQARNRMTQSIIGILVLASTLVIMAILQGFLGYEFLRFKSSPSTTKPAETTPGSSFLGLPGGGNKTENGTTNNNTGTGDKTAPNGTKF